MALFKSQAAAAGQTVEGEEGTPAGDEPPKPQGSAIQRKRKDKKNKKQEEQAAASEATKEDAEEQED